MKLKTSISNRKLRIVLIALVLVLIIGLVVNLNTPNKKCTGELPELGIHAGLADPNFDTDGDCIPNGQDTDANGDGIKDAGQSKGSNL